MFIFLFTTSAVSGLPPKSLSSLLSSLSAVTSDSFVLFALCLGGFTLTVLPNKSVWSCGFPLGSILEKEPSPFSSPLPPVTENASPNILLPNVLNSSSLNISARAELFFSFNLKSSS